MNLSSAPCSLREASLFVAFFVLTGFDCFGQAARPNRGTMPTGSYAVSDIENINLSNGNLNVSIPLASLPPIAGGKLGLTVRAEYNSKTWDAVREELQSDPIDPATRYVVTQLQQSSSSGWRIGAGYSISFENVSWEHIALPPSQTDPEYNLVTQNRWSKVMLHTPDGATHELRPMDYLAYQDGFLLRNYLRGYYKDDPNTANTALRYYSFDGSRIWAKIDPSPSLHFGPAPSWTIYLPDGTRVEQANGVQRIIDTNGNKIKLWGECSGLVCTSHYEDEQTNREIKIVYDAAGNGGHGLAQVKYQTVGGVWMTTTVNFGSTRVFGKVYSVTDPDCADPSVYVDTTIPVMRSIVFPQTEPGQPPRQMTFSYNSDTTVTSNVSWRPSCGSPYQTITSSSEGWGSLSSITQVSGAIINYESSLGAHQLFNPDDAPGERIVSKTVTHDGISESWTYGLDPASSSITSPDGSFVEESRYPSDPAFAHTYAGFGGKEGLVYRTNQSNKILIERHWTLMIFAGGENLAPGSNVLVGFNPVIDAEYTTLLDDTPAHNPVKMSAKTFQYDYNGNLLNQKEYDWFDPSLVSRDAQGVPTAVPAVATLLKETNSSYYNEATTSSSANVYAKRAVATAAPLILNAPKETILGTSKVRFWYDGQAFNVAPTVGNLTTKQVWLDLDSRWITTSNTYGLYRNIATAIDGRGNVTQYFYDDATHALPNRVVVDPLNGTGTQTTTTAYDYHTGLVTSQTDSNGQVSTIDYTNQLLGTVDPFGRPGISKSPQVNISGTNHRHRVTTTYLDSARQVIVATDLNAENDKLIKTRTTSDMLGRPVLTESTEDGTNYTISVKNAYLNMGQVTLTSNPMRSTASSTDSWTRVTKDTVGRVVEAATFGGAAQPAWTGTAGAFTGAVTTVYTANFTTVTDQAGKVRRSMADALGRLRRVDEPDGSGNLGSTAAPVQPTSYAYNVFDNLTTVNQGEQTRTFTYDSLSRLRSAVNPESGTISYQYDDNGNLIVKTDARTDPNNENKKASTHYEYDALNRVKRRWYNGSNAISAMVHDDPSLPQGVGVTDEVKFYYDTQALPLSAPSYTRGSAIGRLVAQTYGTGSNGDYYAYDVLGRPTLKFQQTGTVNYKLEAAYTLSAAVSSLIYPSNNTVTNTYDQAGRLINFSGNLGGETRTYASGNIYSPVGGLLKEQYGTNTPVYHKLHYNSSRQICDVRASNVNDEWGGELGALINYYSTPYEHCGNGANNNGNLLMSQTIINSVFFEDRYTYDSLNRLTAVSDHLNGNTTPSGTQEYDYDRWGNRTIKPASTLGINKQFTVIPAKNRLGVPTGQIGVMQYDDAGNLTNDTYTGAGNRTYDAENKMISAMGGVNPQPQLYKYDGSGQRIKRTVDGVETWQVYGFGGELIAEYAANAAATSPQKEYGYRNGQLLVTAGLPRLNVAAAANGATATASETHSAPYAASGAINGDRKYYTNNAWANVNPTFPQWLQVDFNGSNTIDEIDVFSLQDNPGAPSEPTLSLTFNSYGVTAFAAQYWNGTSWVTVPGGSVTGNNKVWKQLTFSPVTTSKVRVLISGTADGYSRLTEVEVWGTAMPAARLNQAAAVNGGSATASETHSAPYAASGAINGDRKHYTNNAWANVNPTFPQWLQVDFNGSKTIDEIDVFSLQDNPSAPTEPTLSMTFNSYGVTAFAAQYWNGTSWVTVPGDSVTGNNKVWKQLTFSPVTTSKIRVLISGSSDGYSRLTEVEAWGTSGSGASSKIQWLVTDHLGTPRMIIDQTGTLANIKRHDYLPFGEELFALIGGRDPALGYASGDGVRQQFTSKERDTETGLDYFLARYYSSIQGRFTSPDPTLLSVNGFNPQTWNRYTYVLNNPLLYVDPLGLWALQSQTIYRTDENGNEVLDRRGRRIVERVIVTAVRTSDEDTTASLAEQLGLTGRAAENFAQRVGDGNNIRLSEQGGDVGRLFRVVEQGLKEQAKFEIAHPDRPNQGPDSADCSETACRIAFPQGTFPQGFSVQAADAAISTFGATTSVEERNLRLGDIVRWADARNNPKHFASFIFRNDDGVPVVFSKSGVRGPYETVTTSEIGTKYPGYGTIRGIRSGQTGYYHPR